MILRNTILALLFLACIPTLAMKVSPQKTVDWDDIKKEADNRLKEVFAQFPTTFVPTWLHYEIECNLFFVSRQAAVAHLHWWQSLPEQEKVQVDQKKCLAARARRRHIAALARCKRIEEERAKRAAVLALAESLATQQERQKKITQQKEQELQAIFLTNKGLHKRRSYRQENL